MLMRVAWHSLLHRRGTIALTVFSIALSTFVLTAVEHFRSEAKTSFSRTVSDVDLIVGSRTGELNLLLYTVFRMGNPTQNIDFASYREIADHPQVSWTIPLSLGDSHRGYRVLGTTPAYFEHFRYGQKHALDFQQGGAFERVFDAVLGADVANSLGYSLGQEISLAHGLGSTSFAMHDDKPFTVTGILARTGTPVDKTVHVSLAGIEAIHLNWHHGVKAPGQGGEVTNLPLDDDLPAALQADSITAFLVGLKSKVATFAVQRQVNDYKGEALLAILPGVTLTELWQMLAILENVLLLVSALILVAALAGMAAVLLTAMRERQRELLVLRTLGAPPLFVLALVQMESVLICAGGLVIGLLAGWLAFTGAQDYLASHGLFVEANILKGHMAVVIGVVLGAGFIVGTVPALAAYRTSLVPHD